MTHVAYVDALWHSIMTYMYSSPLAEGRAYACKTWLLWRVCEPTLNLMYQIGLTTYKPVAAYTFEDWFGESQ